MAGAVVKTTDRNIVHRHPITRQQLEQIANILGIPLSSTERAEILSRGESIHIYVGAPATSGAAPTPGAPTTSPGGDTS
jgi:hypothetical protein